MDITWNPQSEDEEIAFFRVMDESDGLVIDFDYLPNSQKLWEGISLRNFEFILLDSPYYNAESNIYEIEIDKNKERFGYVIPINALVSCEGYFEGALKNYAYVSYWYLLTRIDKLKNNKNLLTDYFHENLVVCVLNKETLNQHILDYSSDLYLLSFYEKGYYSYSQKPTKLVNGYDYEKLITSLHKIHIDRSQPKCFENEFIKNLFCNYLPYEDVALARFIMSYQAIEHYMSEICGAEIEQIIFDYIDKKIYKNDYFDKVGKLGGERKQISLIFDKIDNSHKSVIEFERECNILYKMINYSPDKVGIANLFYSFRNLLVHNYRVLLDNEIQVLKTIQCFELLIVHICKNFPCS